MYQQITPPTVGDRITFAGGEPIVPDMPIIPFIRGDGTGVDIWPAAQKVFDAAVAAAYGDQRRIVWFKVYAGDEACENMASTNTYPKTPSRPFATLGWPSKAP
jgi:isocitrate dehydrogenase